MKYTNEQYQLMEQLKSGVIWDELDREDQSILIYLDEQRIAQPRADIREGMWFLSQTGEAVLQTHCDELRAQEALTQKQEEANQEIAQKSAEKEANEKTEKRNERAFQIRLAFYSTLFGAFFSNLDRIINVCKHLWSLFLALF